MIFSFEVEKQARLLKPHLHVVYDLIVQWKVLCVFLLISDCNYSNEILKNANKFHEFQLGGSY